VNGQFHTSDALCPGQQPELRIGYEAGWASQLVSELSAQSVPLHLSTIGCQAMSPVLLPFSTFLIFRFALLFQPAASDIPH